MKLKIKKMNFDNGKEAFSYLNKESPIIIEQGFEGGIRIEIKGADKKIGTELVLIDVDNIIKSDEVGLSDVAFKRLGLPEGTEVEALHIPILKSFAAVRAKMFGHSIGKEDMKAIIQDIVNGYYSTAHIAAFCGVCEGGNMNLDEISFLTEAMVSVGQTIKWDYDIVVDKHCIGGIPANRTTNVVIPIVAAYGLHIPKTSSRAITSPSGTADTMEVMCNVDVSTERMKEIVDECNGCIVWGGAVDLSPADDLIINTKKLLNVDSEGQMVASILSKKIAAGSTHILIVVPVGPTAKVRNEEDFKRLKNTFEGIGKKLGKHVVVVHEDGIQPIGNGIGPVLEARDILKLFKCEADAPQDLKECSLQLAADIIEFDPKVKKGEGYKIAKDILESGKAYDKFMQIVKAQGAVKEIPSAKFTKDILAKKDGKVVEIDNRKIAQICRFAGTPEVKVAGLYLYKHLNDTVKKGEKLFTIHADSQGAMEQAYAFATSDDNIMKIN
ncbi:MAG: thymidine phosphorylase family protein [Rickettsiales bacterium]|nr:thymidine phosphorylase family protein [Rickettsiales bacterium]